jgi:hypothetical protein
MQTEKMQNNTGACVLQMHPVSAIVPPTCQNAYLFILFNIIRLQLDACRRSSECHGLYVCLIVKRGRPQQENGEGFVLLLLLLVCCGKNDSSVRFSSWWFAKDFRLLNLTVQIVFKFKKCPFDIETRKAVLQTVETTRPKK